MADQPGDGIASQQQAPGRPLTPERAPDSERPAIDLAPSDPTHLPAQAPGDAGHPAQVPQDVEHLPARVPRPHDTAVAKSLNRIDVWAVGQLVIVVLLLPVSVLSASLLALPFGAARWTVVVVFYVSGACLFVRPIAKAFAYTVLKCRAPTQHELRRLEQVWPSILRRADLDERRFGILIYTGAGVNAVATFGRLVAVTRGAMALPDAELEGILAHELGHHLRFHTFVTAAVIWFTLPVLTVAYMVMFVRRTLRMLGWVLWLSGFGFLLALAMWFLGFFVGLLLLSIAVQSVLLMLFGRFAEYSADDTAVRLGFGRGLLSAFHMMAVVEPVREPPTLVERAWASHPPLYKRIRRLEHTVAA